MLDLWSRQLTSFPKKPKVIGSVWMLIGVEPYSLEKGVSFFWYTGLRKLWSPSFLIEIEGQGVFESDGVHVIRIGGNYRSEESV